MLWGDNKSPLSHPHAIPTPSPEIATPLTPGTSMANPKLPSALARALAPRTTNVPETTPSQVHAVHLCPESLESVLEGANPAPVPATPTPKPTPTPTPEPSTNTLADQIAALIQAHQAPGLTRDEVVALIKEHAPKPKGQSYTSSSRLLKLQLSRLGWRTHCCPWRCAWCRCASR